MLDFGGDLYFHDGYSSLPGLRCSNSMNETNICQKSWYDFLKHGQKVWLAQCLCAQEPLSFDINMFNDQLKETSISLPKTNGSPTRKGNEILFQPSIFMVQTGC